MITPAIYVVVSYLLGAIPNGLFVVKIVSGEDITTSGSGRIGGGNALRAGGGKAFVLTSVLDLLKGFVCIKMAQMFFPEQLSIQVISGILCVLGHNWSIWVYFWTLRKGRPTLIGGAGTAPNIGVAMAFWLPVLFITIPLILFMVLFVGFPSLASISAAIIVPVIFFVRAELFSQPFEYFYFSIITSVIILISLKPNIMRLIQGTEVPSTRKFRVWKD